MRYEIIKNPTYSSVLKIGLKLQPDNEPLRFFVTSMRIVSYPEFLKMAAQDEGWTGDPAGVFYYNDLDPVDFVSGDGFQEDEVQVYHHVYGDSIIKKSFFDNLIYDFSHRLLEEYRESETLPHDWSSQMEEALQLFSRKLTKKS